MKTQYRNMLWLAALPLAFAMGACQHEDIVEAGQSANIEGQTVLRATMGSYNASQSRAQVELGNEDESQEVFMWNAEDAFTVYDTENAYAQHTFTISGYNEESPSAESMFIGEGEISEGTEVAAIYPVQEASSISGDVVTLTLPQSSLTDGSDEAWKSYMNQNMFMYAQATMAGANTALTFNQLCAMVRISYTNATDTDQNISKVTLTGDGNYFGNSMNFNLKTYEENVTPTTSVSLEFTNLTVAPGRTVDFYLLFFPGDDASNGKLTISIDESQVEMSLADMTTQAFEAGKRYWLNVMQTKADGLIWKKDVAEGVIANLPLIRVLEDRYGTQFTKDENGFVDVATNQEAINQITSLNISYEEGSLDNLDGLEYLTNLEELELVSMGLQSLDVSQNVNLKSLVCDINNLTQLDVSRNEKLIKLSCGNNQLKALNVENNVLLEELWCGYNQITDLNVAPLTNLRVLDSTTGINSFGWSSDVASNFITSLDVSQNKELEVLSVSNNQLLEKLDVSNNLKLKDLSYSSTNIIVDFSKNVALERLACSRPLTITINQLDVSMLPNLTSLECEYTGITSLDVSQNPLLGFVLCYNDGIKELDFKNNPDLETLYCGGASLQSLDISNNNSLRKFSIYAPIMSLDLSKKTALEQLICYGCQLSTLDITNNQNLTYIRCGNQYDAEGNEIEMTLLLTPSQQTMWEEQQWEWNNERVKLDVQKNSSN